MTKTKVSGTSDTRVVAVSRADLKTRTKGQIRLDAAVRMFARDGGWTHESLDLGVLTNILARPRRQVREDLIDRYGSDSFPIKLPTLEELEASGGYVFVPDEIVRGASDAQFQVAAAELSFADGRRIARGQRVVTITAGPTAVAAVLGGRVSRFGVQKIEEQMEEAGLCVRSPRGTSRRERELTLFFDDFSGAAQLLAGAEKLAQACGKVGSNRAEKLAPSRGEQEEIQEEESESADADLSCQVRDDEERAFTELWMLWPRTLRPERRDEAEANFAELLRNTGWSPVEVVERARRYLELEDYRDEQGRPVFLLELETLLRHGHNLADDALKARDVRRRTEAGDFISAYEATLARRRAATPSTDMCIELPPREAVSTLDLPAWDAYNAMSPTKRFKATLAARSERDADGRRLSDADYLLRVVGLTLAAGTRARTEVG